jgi:hypothetical protein
VLTFLLILLVVWLTLAGLLAAGSLWIQRYIYNEPSVHILWGAPVAATVLTAFLGFWCHLNYRAADPKSKELPYETIFTSAGSDDASDWVRELWAERGGKRTRYTVYKYNRGAVLVADYQEETTKKPFPFEKSVDAVIIKENDDSGPHETRFVTKYDAGRYEEEGGKRYMTMDNFGRIFTPRPGRSTLMVFLNLVHFAIWFLVVWLLLRFQVWHALGLAAVFWLAMTWLVVPQILAKLPRRVEERTTTAQATGLEDVSLLARRANEGRPR